MTGVLAASSMALAACDEAPAATAGQQIVLIFSHGTVRPHIRHHCDERRDVPAVVRAVAARTKARIHYLCSRATDGGRTGSYTYKRAAEIKAVIDQYRRAGVPARRLFLVGHSAGGWSSLLAARQFGHRFNAVVAFAPAFAGPRHEITRYPWWRRRIRPQQVSDLSYAQRIDALVFAFRNDSFNRPRDLRFLTRIPGVQLVPFMRCGAIHRTTYSACFGDAVADQVVQFIRARSRQQAAVR